MRNRKAKTAANQGVYIPDEKIIAPQKRTPKTPIKYNLTLNEEQKLAKAEILQNDICAILGKAGSGKTLLAMQIALDLLFTNQVDYIYVTRPAVDTGEEHGFIPGDLDQKMAPWLIPIYHNLYQLYPKDLINKRFEKGDIEICPISHIRGRTFLRSIGIVDECQNVTKSQMEAIVTRLGKDSKLIVCGDISQIDLKRKSDSGLSHLIQAGTNIKGFYFTELKTNHRHPIVDEFINNFNKIKDPNK